jgi:hypothetical protein
MFIVYSKDTCAPPRRWNCQSEMTIDHVVLLLAVPIEIAAALALTSAYLVFIDGLE